MQWQPAVDISSNCLLKCLQDWSSSKIEPYGVDVIEERIKEAKNLFPKDLPENVEHEIDTLSRTVYRSLGLRGCGRLDLRVTDKGEVFVIEVNPNPNLAPDDELAQAAQKAGLNYSQLIQKLCSLGISEAEKEG